MISPITAPGLAALAGIGHGFYTRAGGASAGLYASLNCGAGSRDEPALVVENRARVASSLGTTRERLLSPYQIHSARAVHVDAPWPEGNRPDADGIVTATPGLAIGVLTADCAPVLFVDTEARVIGAAHAGWRGALSGVLAATLEAMIAIGARRSRVRAALGPAIGREAYEVGPELEAEFLAADGGHARFFRRPEAGARPRFDLQGFVMARLGSLGIAGSESVGLCTYTDESRFYSFRRATHRKEADYGRQISAIVLR